MRQHFKAYQFCKGPKAAAKLGKLARVSSDVKNMFGRIVIYAKPFREDMASRVAYAYEQATEWHKRHPPLSPEA